MSSEMREVDAFEAWARAQCFGEEELRRIEGRPANKFGLTWEYNGDSVQAAWAAWLERALLARTEAGADGAVAWQRGSSMKSWRGEQWQECTKDEHDSIKSLGYWTDASGFNWPSIARELFTHPQDASGDAEVAWSVLHIGNHGAAYDPPNTRRAFTYEKQPGNIDASRLGRAADATAVASAGDSIDRGLALLKELQAVGFGVFHLGPDAMQAKESGNG